MQPEIFQGWGGFVKLGHFDKRFLKKLRKEAPQGKMLEFFLLDTLKTRWNFFRFQKKSRGSLPSAVFILVSGIPMISNERLVDPKSTCKLSKLDENDEIFMQKDLISS